MTLFSLFRRSSAKNLRQPPGTNLGQPPGEVHGRAHLSGRYGALLTANPEDAALAWGWSELEKNMTIVPAGTIKLTSAAPDFDGPPDAHFLSSCRVSVDAFYVDRCATSNDEFAVFVEDGGYSQPEIWSPEALPHLLQFVDRTGRPSPQYWSNCQPPADRGNHPVVGICWYEALAFARWSGKQLLSPAQWQWAGAWSAEEPNAETKYPWGNAFEPQRANTWSSGVGDAVPVDQYYCGSTPNGVYQLIGNVWEWVSDSLEGVDDDSYEHLAFDPRLGEIRGGAFDTYLETQASCMFRSCQSRLYRGTNVGFRCCLPVAALPSPPDPSAFV